MLLVSVQVMHAVGLRSISNGQGILMLYYSGCGTITNCADEESKRKNNVYAGDMICAIRGNTRRSRLPHRYDLLAVF